MAPSDLSMTRDGDMVVLRTPTFAHRVHHRALERGELSVEKMQQCKDLIDSLTMHECQMTGLVTLLKYRQKIAEGDRMRTIGDNDSRVLWQQALATLIQKSESWVKEAEDIRVATGYSAWKKARGF